WGADRRRDGDRDGRQADLAGDLVVGVRRGPGGQLRHRPAAGRFLHADRAGAVDAGPHHAADRHRRRAGDRRLRAAGRPGEGTGGGRLMRVFVTPDRIELGPAGGLVGGPGGPLAGPVGGPVGGSNTVEVLITVHNTGTLIGGYQLRVLGADPSWVTLQTDSLSLFPDESQTVTATVAVPAGVAAG